MKKKIYLLVLGIILFFSILETKANAATTVSSWSELKSAIDSNSSAENLEIDLSGTNWIVDSENSTITVRKWKKYNN